MDLVDDHSSSCSWADPSGGWSQSTHIGSTIPLGTEHDFDPSLTASTQNPIQYDFQTWNQLCDAVETSKYHKRIVAVEMDLVEARSSRQHFDKIVLLILHGQEESLVADDVGSRNSIIPQDSKLSERGVGQALSLARRISALCNNGTGLVPELFVLAPLRQVLQTAMLALPHYSPFYSFRHIPWLCHSAVATTTSSPPNVHHEQLGQGSSSPNSTTRSSLQNQLLQAEDNDIESNKRDWFERTDAVLDMIRQRDEQVIVVCTESNWLQAFGCVAPYKRSQQLFRHGELRAVGINFVGAAPK